jgi:hypothetical protein
MSYVLKKLKFDLKNVLLNIITVLLSKILL